MTAEKVKTNTFAPRIDPSVIDSVEVTLDAYLGGAMMTVGELSDLAADAVVALDSRLGQGVELRLNGLTVATGELVSVGDHFAVRIVEIARV